MPINTPISSSNLCLSLSRIPDLLQCLQRDYRVFFFFFLVTNRNIKAIFETRNPSLMHRNKHSGWMWPDLNTGVSTRNQPRCLQLAFLVSTGLKIWLRVGQVSLKGSWAYSCYSGYVAPDSSTETNCHRYTEISLLLEHYFTLTMDWWMMAAVYRSTR